MILGNEDETKLYFPSFTRHDPLIDRSIITIIMTYNTFPKDKDTGICCMCLGGHFGMFKLNVERSILDKQQFLSCLNICLHWACIINYENIVEYVIDMMLKIDGNKGILWDDLLQKTCLTGNSHIASLLIKNGANDWIQGLRNACKRGHKNMAMFIYQHGDKVHFWTPPHCEEVLYSVCRGNDYTLLDIMTINGAKDWDAGLGGACRGGHIKMAELMIEKGVTVTGFDHGMIQACKSGHMHMFKFLIAEATKNNHQFSIEDVNISLCNACEFGHKDLVLLLIKMGANSIKYMDHYTPNDSLVEMMIQKIEKNGNLTDSDIDMFNRSFK